MCPMPCHNAKEIQGVEFYQVSLHIISGTQYLVTCLWVYCSKMTEVIHDEKILIHFFYNSLSGVSLS
jgi:hypothetical protein